MGAMILEIELKHHSKTAMPHVCSQPFKSEAATIAMVHTRATSGGTGAAA